jgi:hypothetical protein
MNYDLEIILKETQYATKRKLYIYKKIFLERLKENRKILTNMRDILLVAPWVMVEFR